MDTAMLLDRNFIDAIGVTKLLALFLWSGFEFLCLLLLTRQLPKLRLPLSLILLILLGLGIASQNLISIELLFVFFSSSCFILSEPS